MSVCEDAWMRAADTRKDRYTVLNEVELTQELLGGIYEELREKS